MYFPPHLTSASALTGETGNPEIASFQGRSYIWGNRGGRLGCFQDCCLSELQAIELYIWLPQLL